MYNRFSEFVEQNENIILAAYGGASVALATCGTWLALAGGV